MTCLTPLQAPCSPSSYTEFCFSPTQAFLWRLHSACNVLPPQISMVHYPSPSRLRCHLPSGCTLFILLKLPPASWHSNTLSCIWIHRLLIQQQMSSYILLIICLSHKTTNSTSAGILFGLLFSAVSPVSRRAPVTWLGVQDLFVERTCCFSRRDPLQPVSRVMSPCLSLCSFWSAER